MRAFGKAQGIQKHHASAGLHGTLGTDVVDSSLSGGTRFFELATPDFGFAAGQGAGCTAMAVHVPAECFCRCGGYHRGQRSGIGPKGSNVPDGRRCESSQEKRRVRLSSCRRAEGDSQWSDCDCSLPSAAGSPRNSRESPRWEGHRGNGGFACYRDSRRTSRHCLKVTDFRFWPVACFKIGRQ